MAFWYVFTILPADAESRAFAGAGGPPIMTQTPSSTSAIVARCQELFDDLDFGASRAWKAAAPGRRVVAYMPIYVPRELVHAAGMLPLGILGGGENLEVIHGDAYYQSYICRIPRSTLELGITGRLDFVDGFLFPSICDVIRNLSGIWKLLFPKVYVRYFDVPQNYVDAIGGNYYVQELRELKEGLEQLAGVRITDDALRASIAVYNENRRLINELYAYRAQEPWKTPSSEVYLVLRAGMVLPVEEHNQLLREYLAAARAEERPMRDNCRVVLNGLFCEQPPINLIKSIELSGCYIVDDDFMLINRWLTKDVPTAGDPLESLSSAFLHQSMETSAKYQPNEDDKAKYIVDAVRDNGAEGVIFAAPSFCDPALLERPMLEKRLDSVDVPHIGFKYAENSGQMQPIREQAGTFADSIKLWSTP
jgi:benzoyl-CoA reductase subunit C